MIYTHFCRLLGLEMYFATEYDDNCPRYKYMDFVWLLVNESDGVFTNI